MGLQNRHELCNIRMWRLFEGFSKKYIFSLKGALIRALKV